MLKNILSLLLSRFYSKKDAAEIAALALPNHLDGIAISITEGTNTYIAPADGYINFVTARNGGVNVYGQCLQTNSYPSTNRQAKAFVPISKGKQIIFEIGGETISATFYKLVGGGQTLKKLILQGGVLCRLKHLCNSLRRSSWLVRRRVFRTGRTPTSQIILPFSFHLQKTVLFIHPQATDGCRCTLGTRGLLTSQLILTQRIIAQSCPAFCLPLSVGTATFIEYVKALMSRSQLQLLYRKDGLCFFRLINSAVGGASC
jgi:hypothetical protein